MDQPQTQPRTITIDGVVHDVEQFSPGVQNAIGIYNAFNTDLQTEQLKVMKTQAALQSVGAQIAEAIKAELASKEAANNSAPLDENAADTLPVSNGQDA